MSFVVESFISLVKQSTKLRRFRPTFGRIPRPLPQTLPVPQNTSLDLWGKDYIDGTWNTETICLNYFPHTYLYLLIKELSKSFNDLRTDLIV